MKYPSLIIMLASTAISVQSDLILETTCTIGLSLGSSTDLSLSQIYWIERETAAYFSEILSFDEEAEPSASNVKLLEDETALKVIVSIQEMTSDENGGSDLDGSASLIYRSSSSIPVQLDKVLSGGVMQSVLADRLGSFGPSASVVFAPMSNDSKVLDVNYGTEGASADVGLIGAAAVLSLVLVLVSSVLLYVTGGCTACQQRIGYCLFEEIDEDEDVIYNKSSFQIQATDEESSIATSVPNNASDIGPSRTFDHPNPAEGLGVKTTGRADMGSYFDEDSAMDVNATPVSKAYPQQLGITSMRKMPKQEPTAEEGGLANMIMQRLYSSK